MIIHLPWLIFLGDARDQIAAKTGFAIAHWQRERCVGQMRFENCRADCGLADVGLEQAAAAGTKTMVLGVAIGGGEIPKSWEPVIIRAMELGMDIANGLHTRLASSPAIAEAAARYGRRLFDVRHPTQTFALATGKPRSGKRVLTVGTDASVGKMLAALHIARGLQACGRDARFRATGQTGILVSGEGVAIDAVPGDFIAGAIEWLSPAIPEGSWDVIEGQGSLFHPAYAGVTLGLLHGARPDFLVMCHDPARAHMRGLPNYPVPDLKACFDVHLNGARLTNPEVKPAGICLNTSSLSRAEANIMRDKFEREFDLPTCDPLITGVGPIVDRMLRGL
ncbi:DUF1611 domain-containing protein [Bosea vaviloviae]|uniref:DUF1611 domain-containing protein n=1 Tax=Bosea vaviloviae TaxID=1526658 RepID=UPI0009F1AF40|nr:DUF1611 domain-containing protein [Bosea vaviloviae]